MKPVHGDRWALTNLFKEIIAGGEIQRVKKKEVSHNLDNIFRFLKQYTHMIGM
jgi:hypothetical protein